MPHLTCPHCGEPLDAAPPGLLALCPRCLLATGAVSEFTPPTPEELAPYFPQLEIEALLGHGGMGAVYKARQKELDRTVAVKILPPAASTPEFAERFAHEARALARLNHPHIVTLYDFGQADGLFYFFMEYVDGANLRQVLEHKRLTPDEALAIVPQICDALQFAHDRGIVHRDIKPENILLDKEGRVKIADFGIARLIGAEQSAATICGTPRYMAPEQRETPLDVDHRADIYSLGVVFYQMLTGELPGKTIELPSRKIRLDVRLDEIVLRALEEAPEARYQHASLFKTAVETVSAGSPPSATPVRHPPTPIRRRSSATAPGRPHPGFWARVGAFYIDYIAVSILVLPLIYLVATLATERVVFTDDLRFFTSERIIKSGTSTRHNRDGSTTTVHHNLVELTAFNRWKTFYDEEITTDRGERHVQRTIVSPSTGRETSSQNFTLWVLLLYWIALESSPLQGSLGKRLMKIRVVDSHGRRPTLARAAARNICKILSALPAFLGFLMIGWNRHKQGLHDIIADCELVTSPPPTPQPPPPPQSALTIVGKVILFLLLLPLPFALPFSSKTPSKKIPDWDAETPNSTPTPAPTPKPTPTPSPPPVPTKAELAAAPQIRAIRWQDWPLKDGAWLPSGEAVPDFESFSPATMVDSNEPDTAATAPRYLSLWIWHPLLDSQSFKEATLLNADGTPLHTPTSHVAASVTPDALRMVTVTLCAGTMEATPPEAIVVLRVSYGPWQTISTRSATAGGVLSLGSKGIVTQPTQTADGHTRLQVSRETTQGNRDIQIGFLARLDDGSVQESHGSGRYGVGALQVEESTFVAPLKSIDTFEVRERPIRTFRFKIALPVTPPKHP